MKHTVKFILVFCLCLTRGIAQVPNRGCGSIPPNDQYEAEFQQKIAEYLSQNNAASHLLANYTIPVVIHIIHGGQAIGVTPNITDIQATSQIHVINNDFKGQGLNSGKYPNTAFTSYASSSGISGANKDALGRPKISNFNISFSLAKISNSLTLMPVQGIDRVNFNTFTLTALYTSKDPASITYSTAATFMAFIDNIVKPQTIWDPTKYLNIWITDRQAGTGLLAYSTFPAGVTGLAGITGGGTATTDGLWCWTNAFGSLGTVTAPYHRGRTVTHELGHWLGLRHIWGDGTCLTDYCLDTPPSNIASFGTPTYPSNPNSCTSPTGVNNTTPNGFEGQMFMNFMDYTDDDSMYLFTEDQRTRAQTVMGNGTFRQALGTHGLTNTTASVTADFSLSSSSVCLGQTVTVTDISTSTGSITSWNYSCPGATPAVSTVQNPTFTFSTPGTYTITQIVNSVGLNSSVSHTVQVNANTTAGISSQSITCGGICTGSASVIPNNAAPYTYSWSSIPSNASSVINLCAGNYTCVITNVCGLTLTKTVSITQPTILNATIGTTTSSICIGASVGLSSTLSGGTPPYSINWNTGSTVANITVTPTSTPSVTYILNVNDVKGCTKSISTTIQVYPLPVVNTNHLPILPLCAGKTATINLSGAPSYTTNPGGYTTPTFTVNPTSTTIYNVVGKSTQGCLGYTSDTINVVAQPTIATSASSPTTCLNEIITFTNNGASTYTLLPTTFTGSVISVPINTLGITTFTILGTGPAGCVNSKTISINTYSLPIVTVNPTNTIICSGTPVIITALGATTYTWNNGITLNTITALPVAPTTTYGVIGKNTQGCKNSATSTINLITKPIVSISSPSTIVCQGYTMQVNASGATTYSWSTGAIINPIIIQPFFNQTYSVVGTNGGICKDTAYLPISIIPAPSISATTSNSIVCNNQSTTLTASGSSITYTWMPGFFIGNPYSATINTPTTFTVYGQNTSGCANFSTLFIDIKNSGNITPIAIPNTICIGDSSILSVIGGYVPLWNNNISVVKPTSNATYTANAIDVIGCSTNVTFTVTIDEKCDVGVFNGFTPNGDGINDYFIIENVSKFPNNQVIIFNRWGNKIYQTSQYDNMNNRWDGKFRGKTVDSGTYFYTLLTKEGNLIKKGWIEVTN